MFAKLLKYEWRSNATTFGILSAAVLGVSALGGILLRQVFARGGDLTGTAAFAISTMLFFIILSLIGYIIAVEIMLLVRFYKNKFTDEGYLTFTLPVDVHQIFLSSAVNMLIWSLISGLVLMLGVGIIALISTAGVDMSDFQQVFEYAGIEVSLGDYGWLDVLTSIINGVFGVVMPMTCLTAGAVLAKKHKILAAFGIYYLISIGMGVLEGVLSLATVFSGVMDSEEAYMEMATEAAVISMIVQLVIIVVGYFLSTGLMKRKLNLN